MQLDCVGGLVLDFPLAETTDDLIVYHSDCLHVGIHDGRANEAELRPFKPY